MKIPDSVTHIDYLNIAKIHLQMVKTFQSQGDLEKARLHLGVCAASLQLGQEKLSVQAASATRRSQRHP